MGKDDDNKIVSFEDYRRKRAKGSYQEDSLSEIFKKDLRQQHDLLDWYSFHKSLNKYKFFVHSLFRENRLISNKDAGYVVIYQDNQLEDNINSLIEAIKWEGREFLVLPFREKTFRQVGELVTGYPINTADEAFEAIQDLLLNSNIVLIIKEISRSNLGSKKCGYARSLIKINSDAHIHKKITPSSDIIFVDYANFLQKTWPEIGIYLNIISSPA